MELVSRPLKIGTLNLTSVCGLGNRDFCIIRVQIIVEAIDEEELVFRLC